MSLSDIIYFVDLFIFLLRIRDKVASTQSVSMQRIPECLNPSVTSWTRKAFGLFCDASINLWYIIQLGLYCGAEQIFAWSTTERAQQWRGNVWTAQALVLPSLVRTFLALFQFYSISYEPAIAQQQVFLTYLLPCERANLATEYNAFHGLYCFLAPLYLWM